MLRPLALAASSLFLAIQSGMTPTSTPTSDAPTYTVDGNLIAPAHYREWIFLSTGIDMSYTATQNPDHSMFDNTFVNPTSYRSFLATGTWPDKTTIVLEIRGAESPVSINKRGHTQSREIMGTEIHVKDNGKWSFYDLPANAATAKLIPPPATCYTCHEQHAAVDTTFVQFYPTLLPIATQKHSLSPAYLQEIATPVASEPAK
jgi:hypothetical protein